MKKKTKGFRTFPRLGRGAGAGEAGYVLVAFALAIFVILGSAGLTIDIGRMYVTRSEAQSYCDSAALAAVMKLNGSDVGITNATAAALAVSKGWQFGTTAFAPAATVVEFAKAPAGQPCAGPWSTSPSPATGFNCVQVTTHVSLPLYLLPVVIGSQRSSVAAAAIAKQIELTGPGAGHYAPFSPFGHPIMSPIYPVDKFGVPQPQYSVPIYYNDPFNMKRAELPDTTLQHGGEYNIFWPNDTHVKNDWTDTDYVCQDDQYPATLTLSLTPDFSSGTNNSNRGYLYKSSSNIAATIVAGEVPSEYPPITTGTDICNGTPAYLCDTSGVKENNLTNGLADRVRTDSDSTSRWYSDYHGNGQRVLLMPVNSGACGATPEFDGSRPVTKYGDVAHPGTNTCTFPVGDGTTNITPAVPSYTVIGWGRFFLREASYYTGITGGKGVCAEYIGPGLIEGGGSPAGQSIYAGKLVQ